MENNLTVEPINNLENNKQLSVPVINTNFYSNLSDNLNIQYNKYKKYVIIISIIILIYLLFRYNIITLSFTNLSVYQNKNDNTNNNTDSNKLITNVNDWSLENEIEKIIKKQNIYIQEKKL
jgi:hypothetical protein